MDDADEDQVNAAAPALPGETANLGPLPGYVGYNLRRAQLASFRHLARTAAGLDLTPGQFSLLTFLEANPNVSQKTLSACFALDTSTLSPVLEGLAARGLILRGRAEHDRRSYALRLTAEGKRHLRDMRTRIEEQEEVVASALEPGEREQLLDMLKRVAAALDAADRA